jgi:hypothetical protein
MSKITLVSPISGTAEFSITTPSGTSTDRTLTLPDNSGTVQTELTNGFGFRNRLINSDMRIDQRNAGASVSITDGLLRYAVDRTAGYGTASAGVFSVQRSATAPQGFTNSLLCTVTTASTPSSSHEYGIRQNIEGFNTADLGWGSASAQAITLSFWVRSSVTGTFAGSVANSAYNRAYVFTYSISAANTWEQKSITVPGDTSGTWLTDNGAGIRLNFNLGAGSSLTGTAGVWGATYLQSATGSVNLIATSGATFYITGVQLEAGSVATPFERRPYGTELQLAQRYFEKSFPVETAPSPANSTGVVRGNSNGGGGASIDGYSYFGYPFKVNKRASPTMTSFSATSTGQIRYQRNTGAIVNGVLGAIEANESFFYVVASFGGSGSNSDIRSILFDYTASAEL